MLIFTVAAASLAIHAAATTTISPTRIPCSFHIRHEHPCDPLDARQPRALQHPTLFHATAAGAA
jgi:hypothetical protein